MMDTSGLAARKRSLSMSVGRVFDVLELLCQNPGGLTQREITEALSIPKSSLSGLINEMTERRYVHLDPERRLYFLGVMTYHLGTAYSDSNELDVVARPAMAEIQRLTGEVVNLAVLEGRDVVLIGRIHSTHPLRFVPRLGARVAAHVSAAGKAVLATMEPEAVARLYAGHEFECPGPNAKCSLEALQAELEHVRAAGVAFDDEESHEGIFAIGSAVLGASSETLGALSVVLPQSRADPSRRLRLAAVVAMGSWLVSQACGFTPAIQKKYTMAQLARLWEQTPDAELARLSAGVPQLVSGG
jgi:IclR family transcriptional regulator, KDG regulon repressor